MAPAAHTQPAQASAVILFSWRYEAPSLHLVLVNSGPAESGTRRTARRHWTEEDHRRNRSTGPSECARISCDHQIGTTTTIDVMHRATCNLNKSTRHFA